MTTKRENEAGTLPGWLAGMTYRDWLFDDRRCTEEDWSNLDWWKAYVDLGPSVAGNLGPYWHVPHTDGDTVHRLYPKLLQTKWLHVVRQAAEEYANRERDKVLPTAADVKGIISPAPTGDAEGLKRDILKAWSDRHEAFKTIGGMTWGAMADEAVKAATALADSRLAEMEQNYKMAVQGRATFRMAMAEERKAKEAAEARVAKLEKALKWIDEQRYADRSTVSQDNAWEAWQRLNGRIVAIYDRARAALSPGAGEEK
jgi:hypothetical protein